MPEIFIIQVRIHGRVFINAQSSCKVAVLRCVFPVVCRKTNGVVNISHGNTTVVVWIYGGV